MGGCPRRAASVLDRIKRELSQRTHRVQRSRGQVGVNHGADGGPLTEPVKVEAVVRHHEGKHAARLQQS